MSGEWTLEVAQVSELLSRYAFSLRRSEQTLNDLNVFPVADNDTGSNMLWTVDGIVAAIDGLGLDVDVASLTRTVGAAALGGRGNSGLIIGQFLAGFVSPFDADLLDLRAGLAAGAVAARRAVVTPVEGTMLTVADVVADAAELDPDPAHLSEVAAAAVAATPTQLEALGGVVDSGAVGLALFIDALFGSSDTDEPEVLIECRVGLDPSGPGLDVPLGHRVVGHEIQFRLPSDAIDADVVRSLLAGLGTDVVVAASDEQLAAHFHVDDPHMATNSISAELEGRYGLGAISYEVEPLVERDAS